MYFLVLLAFLVGCASGKAAPSKKTSHITDSIADIYRQAHAQSAASFSNKETRVLNNNIANWLQMARLSLEENRLTTPIGSSAFDYYQKVLKAEPNNAMATAGIKAIVQKYIVLAETSLMDNDIKSAKRYLQRANKVNPKSSRVAVSVKLVADVEAGVVDLQTEINQNKQTAINQNKQTEINQNKQTEINQNKQTEINQNKQTVITVPSKKSASAQLIDEEVSKPDAPVVSVVQNIEHSIEQTAEKIVKTTLSTQLKSAQAEVAVETEAATMPATNETNTNLVELNTAVINAVAVDDITTISIATANNAATDVVKSNVAEAQAVDAVTETTLVNAFETSYASIQTQAESVAKSLAGFQKQRLLLPEEAVQKRHKQVVAYLQKLAKQIATVDGRLTIMAPTDDDLRWIYNTLNDANASYRILANMKTHKPMSIQVNYIGDKPALDVF